jgi:SAM-dependent methyltransferase
MAGAVAEQLTRHPELVRRLFDEKAATWSQKYAPNGRLTGRLTRLTDAAGHHVRIGGAILDLGCGTGDLARCLSNAGFRVTGCDVSTSMLARAAAADPFGTAEWVKLKPDWLVLPFPDGSFDAVVASSVLEYVGSPAVVLAECARVMRPGAVVLATVPDVTHPVRRLEGMVRLLTTLPGLAAAVAGWPRLDNYVTYLRLSRQRHPATWWSMAAARAGLVSLPIPRHPAGHAPLRLLTLQRPKGGHGC